MKRAKAAVKNSDLVLELVDVRDFHNFKRLDGESLLVFNKKDLLKEAVGEGIFISASSGDGVVAVNRRNS